jgi:hypothetical protein
LQEPSSWRAIGIIYGLKDDGTYVVEFQAAQGDALLIVLTMRPSPFPEDFECRVKYKKTRRKSAQAATLP